VAIPPDKQQQQSIIIILLQVIRGWLLFLLKAINRAPSIIIGTPKTFLSDK